MIIYFYLRLQDSIVSLLGTFSDLLEPWKRLWCRKLASRGIIRDIQGFSILIYSSSSDL